MTNHHHFICYIYWTRVFSTSEHQWFIALWNAWSPMVVAQKRPSAAVAEFDMEPMGNVYSKNIENLRDLLLRGLPIFRYHIKMATVMAVLHHWIGGKNLDQDVIENGHLKAKLR